MENHSLDTGYPESGHSSPRSRENEFENLQSWEDPQQSNYKVKFMCSYGGKIQLRALDNQLSYIGGDTKILAVDRNIKYDSLLHKVIVLCGNCVSISLKYQLPGEDLDALISVMNDDDLEHLMIEYDRLYRVSPNPVRLRIFVFPTQNPSLNSSDRSLGFDEAKTEKERFVEALNSAPIFTAPPPPPPAAAPPPPPNNMDFLFGFDKANAEAAAPTGGRGQELEDQVTLPGLDESLIGSDPIQKHIQGMERLRIEEEQGIYQRKNDESLSSGSTGTDYNKLPDKLSQVPLPIPGGVPCWNMKQFQGGVFPASTVSNEQQFYIIPANAYHAPMMRPAPTQGYYTVQRMPAAVGVYRDQQHHQMFNMIPQGAPLANPNMKVTGYSEGFGMVRPATTGGGVGVVTEAGYTQVAYDSNAGRQVIYSAPGGVMGAPPPVQSAAQYQGLAAAVSTDMRPAGALNVEAVVKVAPKATQASV